MTKEFKTILADLRPHPKIFSQCWNSEFALREIGVKLALRE